MTVVGRVTILLMARGESTISVTVHATMVDVVSAQSIRDIANRRESLYLKFIAVSSFVRPTKAPPVSIESIRWRPG